MAYGNALIDLAEVMHRARHEDLERRAAIAGARPNTNSPNPLRSRLGTALVRLGERVHYGNRLPAPSAGADEPC